MSTTDPLDQSVPPDPRPDEVQARRQQRLEQLLQRRDRLAIIAVERQSHDIPDADGYLHELLTVEQAIAHCWPEVHEEVFGAWIDSDVELMHTPETPRLTCAICACQERSSGNSTIDLTVEDIRLPRGHVA